MRPLFATLVAILACALATATAQAAPIFGFNDNSVLQGQLSATQSATLASQAGATASRHMFDWRWNEPQQGNWKLSTPDAQYKADLSMGIHSVFTIMYAPSWAIGSDTPCDQYQADCRFAPGADHLDAWRAAVRKIVTRYPQMAALEIWNEPNLRMFWRNGTGPDPAYYTTLV